MISDARNGLRESKKIEVVVDRRNRGLTFIIGQLVDRILDLYNFVLLILGIGVDFLFPILAIINYINKIPTNSEPIQLAHYTKWTLITGFSLFVWVRFMTTTLGAFRASR